MLAAVLPLILAALYSWLVWELMNAPVLSDRRPLDSTDSSESRLKLKKHRTDLEGDGEPGRRSSDGALPWPEERSRAHFLDPKRFCRR
jgi:hypothetical protein